VQSCVARDGDPNALICAEGATAPTDPARITHGWRIEALEPGHLRMIYIDPVRGALSSHIATTCLRDDGLGLDVAEDSVAMAMIRRVARDGGRSPEAGLDLPGGAAPDPAALDAACREQPVAVHPDGLVVSFHSGAAGIEAGSHLRCNAALFCDFWMVSHAEARRDRLPAFLRGNLDPLPGDDLQLCQIPGCLALSRCPASLGWSQADRASGLAARWQAAVSARD
jgi:hypothetical protein